MNSVSLWCVIASLIGFYDIFLSTEYLIFLQLAKCIEIGLPEIILLLIFSQVKALCNALLVISKQMLTRFICFGFFLQYIPHLMRGERDVFHRFAVISSVIIVWIYAHFLTIGGAYKHAGTNTQTSCRTDRSGIISAAPW